VRTRGRAFATRALESGSCAGARFVWGLSFDPIVPSEIGWVSNWCSPVVRWPRCLLLPVDNSFFGRTPLKECGYGCLCSGEVACRTLFRLELLLFGAALAIRVRLNLVIVGSAGGSALVREDRYGTAGGALLQVKPGWDGPSYSVNDFF